jgi:hypothetical protein
MGAVECRSTRLCADSGRCCKRAVGAMQAGSHAGWWRSRSSPLERVCARGAVPEEQVVRPQVFICGRFLARPLLAFLGGASALAWAGRRVAAGARSRALGARLGQVARRAT